MASTKQIAHTTFLIVSFPGAASMPVFTAPVCGEKLNAR
jgi:hypothetical protein